MKLLSKNNDDVGCLSRDLKEDSAEIAERKRRFLLHTPQWMSETHYLLTTYLCSSSKRSLHMTIIEIMKAACWEVWCRSCGIVVKIPAGNLQRGDIRRKCLGAHTTTTTTTTTYQYYSKYHLIVSIAEVPFTHVDFVVANVMSHACIDQLFWLFFSLDISETSSFSKINRYSYYHLSVAIISVSWPTLFVITWTFRKYSSYAF